MKYRELKIFLFALISTNKLNPQNHILLVKLQIYGKIIQYFEIIVNAKKIDKFIDVPNDVLFYEKNIDNFFYFKQMYVKKKEIKVYMEIIHEENENLSKLKVIKEKYLSIKKGLQNYLIPNIENYKAYYDEWKLKEKIKIMLRKNMNWKISLMIQKN